MSEFIIEKNIPLEERGYKSDARYPFSQMEIGDSFQVHDRENFIKARAVAHTWGKVHNKKFAGRGFRIWRIA